MKNMQGPQAELAMAEHNVDLARQMMKHAHLLTPDPVEQIAGLLTAATTVIEMAFGAARSAEVLTMMTEPSVKAWQHGRQAGGRVQ
jgi:hypothetical protein